MSEALSVSSSSQRSLGRRQRPAKPHKKRWRHDNRMGYLFISPWLIAFFAFTLIPIVASFVLAFTNYDVLRPTWRWVGFENMGGLREF